MNAARFLDSFRPFRRGEIALAKCVLRDPQLLRPLELEQLRYAIRLAQLSAIGAEPDTLVGRLGSYRLQLLQMLAPVLPTDPERVDPDQLAARMPAVAMLVEMARRVVLDAGLASEAQLDREVAEKHLVLVHGGAGGAGYVFLGALEHLRRMGVTPSYLLGCSVGGILAVIRARHRDFDLAELLEDVQLIRSGGVFKRPEDSPRYGVPAALRLDLQGALGSLFARQNGEALTLGELAIPVDILATGLGPGALSEPRESYARLVDVDLASVGELPTLSGGVLRRAVGSLVSLAMSRQVLVPVVLGADPATAGLSALDAAGFSAAIPGLLSYDLAPDDTRGAAILDPLFEQYQLVGLVDGALTSIVPARYAWEAVEAGRIGSRNCVIVALDAVAKPVGANAVFEPLLRAISASVDRDHAFWDLHVAFEKCPSLLNLFPTDAGLRQATADGDKEFAETAALLGPLLAPLQPWKILTAAAP